jgi:hypothetical protein
MIDPKKWYSIKQIQEEKLLPMFKSRYLILKWIEAKAIKAVILGKKDKGRRYLIKGSWLIDFIANFEK